MNLSSTIYRGRIRWASRIAALAMIACVPFQAAIPTIAWAESETSPSVNVEHGGVRTLQLGVGRSLIVDLPEDASEIFVGEPKVANAIVRSPRRLYVSTLAAGQTTIFALAADGRKIAVLEISVGRDVGELGKLLEAAIPGNDVHVRTVGESIILTGSVANAGEAQKAYDIATGFISSGGAAPAGGAAAGGAGKVVNSLMIRGLDQVTLKVTISEIRRNILKQLGVNIGGAGAAGSTGTNGLTNLNIQNPFGVNGLATSSSTASIGWSVGNAQLAATLQAFEQQGVARTLAEPTVTATSGESAKFLAGGTYPIPGGETCTNGVCLLAINQQPYGVTLNFTPVVLSQNRISLRVATEVTEVDTTKTIQVNGSGVPGFRTRRNETTVELPSGGSIASAGLISSQTQQAVSGLPGLMNLPVLGALFRSHDYLRQETELLIVVTPYIVHAIDPQNVTRVEQNLSDASDPQAWLLGRVNRLYSTSGTLQPMPGYSAKIGLITD